MHIKWNRNLDGVNQHRPQSSSSLSSTITLSTTMNDSNHSTNVANDDHSQQYSQPMMNNNNKITVMTKILTKKQQKSIKYNDDDDDTVPSLFHFPSNSSSSSSPNSFIYTNRFHTSKGGSAMMNTLIGLFCFRNEQQHFINSKTNTAINNDDDSKLIEMKNDILIDKLMNEHCENDHNDDDGDEFDSVTSSSITTSEDSAYSSTPSSSNDSTNESFPLTKVLVRFIDDEPCRTPIVIAKNNNMTSVTATDKANKTLHGILRLRNCSHSSNKSSSSSSSTMKTSNQFSDEIRSSSSLSKRVHFAKPLHTFTLYSLS